MHSVPESSQVDIVIVRAANNKALRASIVVLTRNLNYLDAVNHALVRLNEPERDDQV